jgi:exosome complex component RRP43
MTAAAPAPAATDKTSDDQTLTEAAAYKRLYPVEYLRRFVTEDVRPDGREKDQWRDVRINVGTSIDAKSATRARFSSGSD